MSYKRSKETKRRLKKLYDETWHSYGRGAWYDEFENRYIRYSAVSSGTGKYFRRRTNKKIRKKKDLPTNGGQYRKEFDYWCEFS